SLAARGHRRAAPAAGRVAVAPGVRDRTTDLGTAGAAARPLAATHARRVGPRGAGVGGAPRAGPRRVASRRPHGRALARARRTRRPARGGPGGGRHAALAPAGAQ